MSQKQLDDLAKKSRELEEKERVLNAREGLLEREKALEKRQKVFDETEVKLDVLNKQIKAKEAILASLNDQIEQASLSSHEKVNSLLAKERVIEQGIELKKREEAERAKRMSSVDASIKSKKHELASINDQIKESKAYSDEQSRVVENTINEWNNTLMEFRKEADLLQNDKNRISADIIRLEQEKTAMLLESQTEEKRIATLKERYEQKADEYKRALRGLDESLSAAENRLSSLNNVYDMKTKELETREKSLRLKQGDVNRRELELDQKERRLRQNYGMSGMDYDDVV